MKLRVSCIECLRLGISANEPVEFEFVSDGAMIARCSRGHETPLAIQNHDFELLFDMGCMALLDGYSREAVTSMAAALERAYMFYVKCIVSQAVVSDTKTTHLIKTGEKKFLDSVSKQSERQLGAFLVLYTVNEKNVPPQLAPKLVEFRNDCVHKGHVPSGDKVMKYAEAVVTILDHLVEILLSRYSHAVQIQVNKNLLSRLADGRVQSTLLLPTIVSLSAGRPLNGTLADRVAQLKKRRGKFWLS